MKIAFDATVLHGHKSGVGYYCEELLKAMVAQEHEAQFLVFSHRALNLDLPSANGNVRLADARKFPVRAFYMHAMLPQLLREVKPDLCHYTNFIAPFADDTPYVVTIHDMGLERLRSAHPVAKRLYTRRLVPRAARGARLIITNSEYSRWEIVRYLGIPETRIRVTPLAPSDVFEPLGPAERYRVLSKYRISAPYLLYVGNIEPRKNIPRLLEAFATLNSKDHEFIIVGNPWYRGRDAAEAARSLGIANRVRFLGYVPRSDLPSLYSGATAFVYPSLLEGFGLPVVEAMACGVPVITSNNSSLKEISGDAALLVDPTDVRSIQQAMSDIIDDGRLAATLAERGLARARQYTWDATASATLAVYEEAVSGRRTGAAVAVVNHDESLVRAIRQTVDYCAMFQYPLRLGELRDRLFDVKVDAQTLEQCCNQLDLPRVGDFISINPDFVSMRHFRETVSDRAITELWPHFETLSRIPFVRMIAFSGATAHRNMTNAEDVDLFMVVEDGKLWATFLIATIWAKLKGLRRRLCVNYVLADRALPLFDHDLFTAQQAASLKPIFGKAVYDEFISANEFIQRRFPNFDPAAARNMYPEIKTGPVKYSAECILRAGPIQILEDASRYLLGLYLRRKVRNTSALGNGDVLLERRRLKLHINSHRQEVLGNEALNCLRCSDIS